MDSSAAAFSQRLFAGGPVQGEQAVDEESVIVEIGIEPGLPGSVRVPQTAFRRPQVREHGVGGATSVGQIQFVLKQTAGVGEAADHQTVGAREHFCIG